MKVLTDKCTRYTRSEHITMTVYGHNNLNLKRLHLLIL